MNKFFTLSFCLIFYFFSFSQDCGTIVRSIDLLGTEDVSHSATAVDGHVFIAGGVSRQANIQAGFLVKTDTLGNVIWSRVIASSGIQYFRKIIPTKDSGCITVGRSSSYPLTSSFSGWVVKWDKNGVRQWSRAFSTGSFNGDWILGGIETSDGGYLFTGLQNAGGMVGLGVALKTNNIGEAQWIRLYDLPEGFEFQGANEVIDGYILCGEYLYGSNTSYRPLISKIDKLTGSAIGSSVSYTIPGNNIMITTGALKGRQGGYFLNMAILTSASGLGPYYHLVSYIDSTFNVEKTVAILHQNAKFQSIQANIFDMAPTSDGGFVGALGSTGGTESQNDADMYKIGANGNVIWRSKIARHGAIQMTGVSEIGSNNFVFTGSWAVNENERDILWLRNFVGSNSTSCGLVASDATILNYTLSKISINFTGQYNVDLSNWKTFTPPIESDNYSVTYTCGFDCSNNVLPLKIRSINVDHNAGSAVVNWITENENMVSKISLLRSYNGTNFEELESIIPKGEITNQYTFIDQNIHKDKNVIFYRVVIMNNNGTTTMSKIVSVTINGSGEPLKIVPNPNKGSFSLQIMTKETSEIINLVILDQSGRAILTQNEKLSRGNNSIFVELKNSIPSGIYFLSVSGKNRHEIKKLYIR